MTIKAGKLNNSGSTLVTVIICMALFSILGALVLSVTMANFRFKMIESRNRKNFYSCETAMEEILTGIEEITAAKIKKVYEEKVFNNYDYYAAMEEDELNYNVKKLVASQIMREIGNADALSDDDLTSGMEIPVKSNDIFNAYLSPAAGRTVTIGDPDTNPDTISSDVFTVRVEDIRVVLKVNGNKSAITSDIVITLPDFSIRQGQEVILYRMESPWQEYALIADGLIKSNNTGAKGNITGSVYAGKGIIVDGCQLQEHGINITGDDIITKGDITVADTASLTIGRYQTDPDTGAESFRYPIVWADNLVVKTQNSDISSPTTMDINGICFIRDDLNLEGKNCVVRLKGAYAGYSGMHNAKGSSIIINGTGATLDLSELESLIIAGRANVIVMDEDSFGDTDIMTGESLAFKSNQRAYLIPGKYIQGVWHNPITYEDRTSGFPDVIFNPADPMGYLDYVAARPYKLAAKRTFEGDSYTILYYYYLNFTSGRLADQFMINFHDTYPDVLNNTEPFSISSVTLPDNTAEIISAGNLMYYDGSGVGLREGLSTEYATDEELDNYIRLKELSHPVYGQLIADGRLKEGTDISSLPMLYSKMSHLLSLTSNRAYREGEAVVPTSVKPGAFDAIDGIGDIPEEFMCYGTSMTFDETNPPDSFITLVKGDVTLNCDYSGFLAAEGTITVGEGRKVNGILVSAGIRDGSEPGSITDERNIILGDDTVVNGRLIAAGNIILGSGNTVTAAETELLTYIFTNYSGIMNEFFRNIGMTRDYSTGTSVSGLIDLTGMISYENWRRK
jgi:type II secretory pathway pseudopilin PulG